MPMLLEARSKIRLQPQASRIGSRSIRGRKSGWRFRQTPLKAVAYVYRDAFSRMVIDPEFIERSKKAADDFTPISYEDVEVWMKALASTPSPALEFIAEMMRGQGVKID